MPNDSARSLRTNTTMTVGLVVPYPEHVFAAIAQSLDETLMAAGRTLLADSADDPDHEARVVQAFLERGVDGLAIAFVDEHVEDVKRDLRSARIPLVLLDREVRGLAADRVLRGHRDADHHRDGGAASRGPPAHRTADPADRGPSGSGGSQRVPGRRRRGSARAERRAHRGFRAARRLRPAGPGADAHCAHRLRDRDHGRVPGANPGARHPAPAELSLISYDDSTAGRLAEPPISSLVRDPSRMGALAGTMILQRLNGFDGPPRKVVLPTRFIARGSVGPPARVHLERLSLATT